MSEFEDIQRLIRLKRHEQPSPEFVEDFVFSLQQRQRTDLLQQSARGLLWERVNVYLDSLVAPQWRFAGATAMALAAMAAIFTYGTLRSATASRDLTAESSIEARPQKAISEDEVERYLISRHYNGGLGDEHPQPQLPQGSLLPAGFKVDLDAK
ncbi:MAG: hypothetical protein ACOYMN_21960 [Roseimicrobium sp.]